MLQHATALVAMAAMSGVAAHGATLYGLTSTHLVRFDSSDPSSVTVIGPHGLPDAGVYGTNYLAWHPGEGKFFGVYFGLPAPHSEQSLFTIDPVTGAGQFVASLGNTAPNDNYFESIEYHDALGTLVISRGPGTFSAGFFTITPAGVVLPLAANGLDNDYSVYDHTRNIFYITDPNGAGQLVVTNPVSGAAANQGALGALLGDMAYDAGDDAIYTYDYTTNRLHRITTTNGFAPIARVDLGPIAGDALRGLAVIPCDEPGDADGDGDVDFNDLNIVLDGWTTPGPQGDLNQSGLIDFDDLNLLLSRWGQAC